MTTLWDKTDVDEVKATAATFSGTNGLELTFGTEVSPDMGFCM